MATSNVEAGILSALKGSNDGMTGTAIAHAAGFSKAARIMKDLEALVDAGKVELITGGRYDLYKLVGKTVAKSQQQVEKNEKTDEKVTIVEGEKVASKLPEASANDLRGYTVTSILYKGEPMKKIVTPDGKSIRVGNDEKLLVINNEPKYTAKTAEDVITCIKEYAASTGLNVFTIDDIKMNRKISNEKDVVIKDEHIMFLSIKKHNKAA